MATKEPTQKAKLTMRAVKYPLTLDQDKDYFLRPKSQKCLTLDELAAEVAALSTRQEDAEDIARIVRQVMQRMVWFLSSGYSISLPIGHFRLTAQGLFMEDELNAAPDRKRLTLGVSYVMSDEVRKALDNAEIDVEIQKSAGGPQLYGVVSAHDAQNPEAVTRGQSVPIAGGQTCILKGKNIKIGGTGDDIGLTLTRVDDSSNESFFLPPSVLYPNTASKIGFIMPASATSGSEWSLKICTQLSSGGTLLKSPRTVVMDSTFVVGEPSAVTPGEEEGNTGQGTFG